MGLKWLKLSAVATAAHYSNCTYY